MYRASELGIAIAITSRCQAASRACSICSFVTACLVKIVEEAANEYGRKHLRCGADYKSHHSAKRLPSVHVVGV